MWRRLFLLLFVSAANFCVGQKTDYTYEEITLHCVFEQLGDNYGCNIKNLALESRNAHVQDVTNSHKTGRSNSDVATIYSFNTAAKYIPKRLGFVFPNLKTLMITKSHLRLIEFRDFRNMKKLQKLHLPENKIEKLPACIFKYTENLEIIDVSGNKIITVDEDTFVNLPNLQQFIANDNDIMQLESGLFRNNLNLKKLLLNHNDLEIVEVNFVRLSIEVVDFRANKCINLVYGCCRGVTTLREFQNKTSASCQGPEIC